MQGTAKIMEKINSLTFQVFILLLLILHDDHNHAPLIAILLRQPLYI